MEAIAAKASGKRRPPDAEPAEQGSNINSVNETLASNGAPKKRFYRSRAHCNPLSHNDGFSYPMSSLHMDWSSHYPEISEFSIE